MAINDVPDDIPHLPPPLYHLTTSLTLLCHADGAAEPVQYHWSTTAPSNFTAGSTSVFNRNTFLTAADAGQYTCSVTDTLGQSGRASIDIKCSGKQK